MRTYQHIISQLTETAKIRLLTDLSSLAEPEMTMLGVPRVQRASMRDGGLGGYPSSSVLARSWDVELVRLVSERMGQNTEGEVCLVSVPGAKATVSPLMTGLSEDPYLSCELASGFAAGCADAGRAVCAEGLGFSPAERACLDSPLPPRTVAEWLTRPYRTLLRRGQLTALTVEDTAAAEALRDRDREDETVFFLCRKATGAHTVKVLRDGLICEKGSADALQSALHAYRRLRADMERGRATMGDLDTAIREGEVFTEEALDDAVDRLLCFAAACARVGKHRPAAPRTVPVTDAVAEALSSEISGEETASEAASTGVVPPADVPSHEAPAEGDKPAEVSFMDQAPTEEPAPVGQIPAEEIALETGAAPAEALGPAPSQPRLSEEDPLILRAFAESVILLENRKSVLPLEKPMRLCLVGETAAAEPAASRCAALLATRGHKVVGIARGYDSTCPNPLLSGRAAELAEEAALACAEADVLLLLLRDGAHADGGMPTLPPDQLALCDRLAATGKPVIAILSTERAPRMDFCHGPCPFAGVMLAAHETWAGLRVALETVVGLRAPAGRLTRTLTGRWDPLGEYRDRRVGTLLGYRFFDTLGCGALYPFGYGLTYTAFTYSDLTVDGRRVRFTVRNTGERPGVEIPQVYLGMNGSAVARPRKELMGFARVELSPGASVTVELPLQSLPVYDGTRGGFCSERGSYTLYVGASVSDIRLTAAWEWGEDTLTPEERPLSDTLPNRSNILTDQYTLEAPYTPMKAILRNPVVGIAALVLAVSVKIYDVVSASNSVFLNIVAALLALGGAAFFFLEILDRKKRHAADQEAAEQANFELFEGADTIPVPSAEALFAEVEAELYIPEEGTAASTPEGPYDHFADVDKELTLPVAARELAILAAERGVTLSEGTARSLLASLAASRLVVLRHMEEESFRALMTLLCEYFACPLHLDRVDAGYACERDVLLRDTEEGETHPRGVLNAMEAARAHPESIHIAALTDVAGADMPTYFVPFARYARTPLSRCAVTALSPAGEETVYTIPENLWFILNMKDEPVTALPDHVCEIASVQRLSMEMTSPAEGHTDFRRFSYGQMVYLCDRVRSSLTVDEEIWKRLDRLEAYAARFGEFRVSNKLWLGLETYLAVLLAGGGEEASALDETLAVRLIPSLLHALDGKLPKEERSLSETLDSLLGEDRTALCRRAVKESGATVI